MTDFIRDDGEIRNCTSNIAKMSIWQYIKFNVTQLGYIKKYFFQLFHCAKSGFDNLFIFLILIVGIPFTPINLIINAMLEIRRAKQQVDDASEEN